MPVGKRRNAANARSTPGRSQPSAVRKYALKWVAGHRTVKNSSGNPAKNAISQETIPVNHAFFDKQMKTSNHPDGTPFDARTLVQWQGGTMNPMSRRQFKNEEVKQIKNLAAGSSSREKSSATLMTAWDLYADSLIMEKKKKKPLTPHQALQAWRLKIQMLKRFGFHPNGISPRPLRYDWYTQKGFKKGPLEGRPTALQLAIQVGNPAAVSALLENGADANAIGLEPPGVEQRAGPLSPVRAPLSMALYEYMNEITRRLLQAGADPYREINSEAIHDTIRKGNIKAVELLGMHARFRFDLIRPSLRGGTPLHTAVEAVIGNSRYEIGSIEDKLSVFKYLVSKMGPSAWKVRDRTGQTPFFKALDTFRAFTYDHLHVWSAAEKKERLSLFQKHILPHVDTRVLNMTDEHGWTPLDYVTHYASSIDEKSRDMLRQRGARLKLVNPNGTRRGGPMLIS